MWLLTPLGFFSAVADKDKQGPGDLLQIRGRSVKDIEGLAAWLKSEHGVDAKVVRWPGRDYQARVIIERELWGSYLVWASEQITYTNFKNEVGRLNKRRAGVYSRVWQVLLAIMDENDRPQDRGHYGRSNPVGPVGGTRALQSIFIGDDDEEGAAAAEDELALKDIGDMTDEEWARYCASEGLSFPDVPDVPLALEDIVEVGKRGSRRGKKAKGKGKTRRR